MIKAIIFDFGRVISSQKPHVLFERYEADLGLAPGMINRIMFDSHLWQEALIGRKTLKEFWYAIGPDLGLETHQEIEDFRRRYQADESINEAVVNLIRQLHGQYKLAVLSNYPAGLTEWLSDWKVLHFFDVVFCSGDEGRVKPDPAAFNITLKRLGVLPGKSVFIDDTAGHVAAARKLGMHAILFTTAEALASALNDLLGPQNNPPMD
jgi:putative hydrolase of the HAD superfamily